MDGKEEFKKEMEQQMKSKNSERNLGLKDKAIDIAKNGASNMNEKFSNTLNSSMAQEGGNDSLDNAADNLTDKSKGYAKKGKDLAKKGLKSGKNAIKNARQGAKVAKKGAEVASSAASSAATSAGTAAASSAGSAIGSAIAAILPYILIAVAIILVFLLLWWVLFHSSDDSNRRDGNYITDKNGNMYAIQPDWEDRLKLSYYATFGERAYYYTIDDDSTLYQGGTQEANKVKDKFSRELSFSLSPSLIQYLDEKINGDISLPEQFIKPVYNTCSTGETSDGLCSTKQLVNVEKTTVNNKEVSNPDYDALIVKSQGYKEENGTIDLGELDEQSNGTYTGKYYTYDANQSTISDSKTISVSSWGLAPILHYKKYDEKRWAQDLKVTKVTYFDENKNEYKDCEWNNCPDNIKKELTEKSDVKKVENSGQITEATLNNKKLQNNKIDETTKKVYLIDNVATLVGTVGNEISEVTQPSGEKYYTDVVVKNVYDDHTSKTDSDLLTNEDYKKTFNIIPAIYIRDTNADNKEELKGFGNNTGYFNSNVGTLPSFGPKTDGTVEDDVNTAGSIGWLQYTGNSRDKTDLRFENCTKVEFNNINNLSQFVDESPNSKKNNIGSFISSLTFRNSVDKNASVTCTYEDGTKSTKSLYFKDIADSIVANREANGDKVNKGSIIISFIIESFDKNGVRHGGEMYGVKVQNNFYSIEGDYWTTEYKYNSNAPSTDNLDNGTYLKAYIQNYEAYYTKNDWNEGFTAMDFKDIFDHYLNKAEGHPGEYWEETIAYNSDYGKLLLKMYGDRVFLRRDSYIQLIQNINDEKEEKGEEGGEVVSDESLPIGTKKEEFANCEKKLSLAPASPISKKRPLQLIKEAAEEFGVDYHMMIAIANQEGSCNYHNWTDYSFDNPSDGGAYGVFQMQVSAWRGQSITAYSYTKNSNVTITMNSANMDDNIKFGAMYYANLIRQFNGNALLALQGYNWGGGGVYDYALTRYAKTLNMDPSNLLDQGYMYDIGWLAYREGYSAGDLHYVENVMRYYDKNTIDIKINAGNTLTYDLNKITGGQFLTTTENDFLAQYIYWGKNKNTILANWDTFYPFKNSKSFTISTEKNKFPENSVNTSHDTPYLKIKMDPTMAQEVIDKIFAETLSAVDGSAVEDNMNLSDIEWKKKFTALFSSYGVDSLEEDIPDLTEYFLQFVDTPLENIYIAYRPYGRSYNKVTEKYESNADIIMKGTYGKEAKASAGGTVSQITSNCVTVDSSIDSSMSFTKHTAAIEYCNIEPSDKLSTGQRINKGDVVGKIRGGDSDIVDNSGNAGFLYLSLILDGNYEDASYILKYAEKASHNGIYGETNAKMNLASNEITKKFKEFTIAHADLLDKWMKLAPADFDKGFMEQTYAVSTIRTAGSGLAAYAPFGSARNHDAVDQSGNAVGDCTTGKRYCNNIYALGNGVILQVVDGNPDTGIDGHKPGNEVLSFYRNTKGQLILVRYHHTAQGSTAGAVGNQTNSMVQKGQWIGTMGNSGMSSGAHTHITFLNFGYSSLAEAMQIIQEKGITASLNFYSEGNLCRSSGGRYPCWEVPEEYAKAKPDYEGGNNPTLENVCENIYSTSAVWGNKNSVMNKIANCPDDSPAKTNKPRFMTNITNTILEQLGS